MTEPAPASEIEPRWAKTLRRRMRRATVMAVAALLLGPAAGFATARLLEEPGPAGIVGPQGKQGVAGQDGEQGAPGPAGEVDPFDVQQIVSREMSTLQAQVNRLKADLNNNCVFTADAVTDVYLSGRVR